MTDIHRNDSAAAPVGSGKQLSHIEIIWDRDHGSEHEGWFIRRHYHDDGISVALNEDENLGDTGYDLDDTDEDIIRGLLCPDDSGVPVQVIR